jgi:hypothetical protein
MKALVVSLPVAEIHGWESFHAVFRRVFGFPDFYGRNMDAWIDCMTDLDDPSTGMTQVSVGKGDMVVLSVDDAADFLRRCPEQHDTLIECAAFVNFRRVEMGQAPVLALLLNGYYGNKVRARFDPERGSSQPRIE